MKTALVVIDVQNFFAVEKAKDLPVKIADHIKGNKYDYTLFTIMRFDPSSNFEKILHWPGPTKSPEIDIHPALIPYVTPETKFEKTTYSAFKSAQFTDFLQKHQITRLFFCGIDIDACVLSSAFEAFDFGFDVKILEELSSVSSSKQEYEEAGRTIIRRSLKRKPPKS